MLRRRKRPCARSLNALCVSQPHSPGSAKDANAAGPLGYYETAVNQIFKTQPEWSSSGDVDSMLAQVIPPDAMQKVRDVVEHDATLDDTIARDIAIGREDQIHQTPSLVIVAKGTRQLLPRNVSSIC
jgi:protein-disulfide isomerase